MPGRCNECQWAWAVWCAKAQRQSLLAFSRREYAVRVSRSVRRSRSVGGAAGRFRGEQHLGAGCGSVHGHGQRAYTAVA